MRRKITNELWEQIKTAFASGIGLREIARNMNIPEGTVLAHAKRESWTQQIQSAKALAKREDALDATPVEAVAMSMQQRGERHVERLASVPERAVDHIETMNGPEILNSVDQIVQREPGGWNIIQPKRPTRHLVELFRAESG